MKQELLIMLKQQVDVFCVTISEKIIKNCDKSRYKELLRRWQEFHNIYITTTTAMLQQWAEKYKSTTAENDVSDRIEAESIVVEVMDYSTGKLFRRTLPIKYVENHNGLMLSGETMDGKPSQIAFLSETAVNKINDLVGKGPDVPRCEH